MNLTIGLGYDINNRWLLQLDSGKIFAADLFCNLIFGA